MFRKDIKLQINNSISDLLLGATTTCDSQDMYWNLMAVFNDAQRFMFTNGQCHIMRGAYRMELDLIL